MLESLFTALAPQSVLVCWAEQPRDDDFALPAGTKATLTSCGLDDLAHTDLADVALIWMRGFPSWHAVRTLATHLELPLATHGGAPPVVFVDGGPIDPVPTWSTNAAYAAHLARLESSKDGVRSGLEELARRLDPESTLLSWAPGRGAWALLPSRFAAELESWLAGRAVLFEALSGAHRDQVELVARSFALFELLERSQRAGTAVVRSTRFRLGTRLVRLGRQVTRKDGFFTAPSQILKRQKTVDTWRARLAADRPVQGVAPALGELRVTYVLPELRLSGGALVVLQLVNELRLLGVDARIATLKVREDAYRTRLLGEPMLFDSEAAMLQQFPMADVVVATHWSTASLVRRLVDSGRGKCAAYFIQDYEAWFYPESDTQTRDRVEQTYALIPNRIATSAWLQDLLGRDRYPAHKRAPGLDLGFFYPRPLPHARPARPVVLAMARPRTPRRGFDTVVATLEKVHRAAPDVEIVLFGEKIAGLALPFPYRGAGVVTDQEKLARLYSRARVHFDGSEFQAFGKAGLEAMACGAVSVLTEVGGVNEYARNEENALLVPPRDPQAAADAILRLLDDDALYERLRDNGLATVPDYSMKREARDARSWFESLLTSGPEQR
jgi:glycosyltransferase involved in cell wall biosynthesis